jgi:putative nucleotidyltransferase with HDIG domain
LEEGALWRHSVAAAVAAENMPRFCSIEAPPEIFTAALLHDVGKQVMGRFLGKDILSFIAQARDVDHLSQLEAERQILGVHHGELGGLIAQHWELPPRVVQGIIHHHEPNEDNDAVCYFVCVANQVAKRIEASLEARKFDFKCPPDVVARLGMSTSQLEDLCHATAAHYAQVSLRYNAV